MSELMLIILFTLIIATPFIILNYGWKKIYGKLRKFFYRGTPFHKYVDNAVYWKIGDQISHMIDEYEFTTVDSRLIKICRDGFWVERYGDKLFIHVAEYYENKKAQQRVIEHGFHDDESYEVFFKELQQLNENKNHG